jgi:signal transduction histidine kinase
MGLAIARKAIERHGGALWHEPARATGGASSASPCRTCRPRSSP